jgi:hypothetical protein
MNMTEPTLENLAKRIEAIEQKLSELSQPAKSKDWRKVVGISEDNEFSRLVLAEIEANSEAERQAALEENPE